MHCKVGGITLASVQDSNGKEWLQSTSDCTVGLLARDLNRSAKRDRRSRNIQDTMFLPQLFYQIFVIFAFLFRAVATPLHSHCLTYKLLSSFLILFKMLNDIDTMNLLCYLSQSFFPCGVEISKDSADG